MRRFVVLMVVAGVVGLPALAGAGIQSRVVEPELAITATVTGDEGAPELPRAKRVVTEVLGLDEGQVAQWETLWEQREAAVAPLREQLRSTEEQLRELLKSENPDPGAVGTLVLSGKTLREGIGDAHRAYVDAFEALLSVEQKAKLGAIRRAARLAPLLPAFGMFGLIVPPGE